jgi:hypothetical protein
MMSDNQCLVGEFDYQNNTIIFRKKDSETWDTDKAARIKLQDSKLREIVAARKVRTALHTRKYAHCCWL